MLRETNETPFYPFPVVLRDTANAVNEVLDVIAAAMA
jgi:hypothetical protein